MLTLIGLVYNFLSIVLVGDYAPHIVSDGAFQEDSSVYHMAYHIAAMVGTL